MNSPNILSPCGRDYTDPRVFTDTLILDIETAVTAFHERTADMQVYEDCIDQVIEEILLYIEKLESATDGLETLQVDLRRCYNDSNSNVTDGDLLAEAAFELGKVLYAHFYMLGVYMRNGVLPYKFGGWFSRGTPFFTRTF